MLYNSYESASLVKGIQLKKARELLQLSPEEISQEINVTVDIIHKWEEETERPNLSQLEELAKLYGRDIDYFLRVSPNPPKNIEFRGKPGKNVKDLSRDSRIMLARFDELCRTALELEVLLEEKREFKLPRFRESDSPESIAQAFREMFCVGIKPLSDLREHLEKEGFKIFELPIPEDTFSGFSFSHTDYGPCVLLNSREPKGRKNFTLAHEIGHLSYHHGSSLCYIPIQIFRQTKGHEYKANRVAVELLLPKFGINEDFGKRKLSYTPSKEELSKFSVKWGVSLQALGYRLENLGLIETGLTNEIVEVKQKYFRKPKKPSYERQLGKRFVYDVLKSYNENLISISKLAHIFNIPIRKAHDIVEGGE